MGFSFMAEALLTYHLPDRLWRPLYMARKYPRRSVAGGRSWPCASYWAERLNVCWRTTSDSRPAS